MHEVRTQGIILKAIPYQDSHRIVTIFTLELGLVSLLIKNLSKKKPTLINLTTPLCRSELIFRKGKSNLYQFVDGAIIDMHLKLRQSYKHLKIAGKMLNAIATSQMPEQNSPLLFKLFSNYLKHLSIFPSVDSIWASFQLKLLKYEGLLDLKDHCNTCTQLASSVFRGESCCRRCVKTPDFSFNKDEWDILLSLFNAQSFEYLKNISISSTLSKNIETIYYSLMGT